MKYDVVIIGNGLAGNHAALGLKAAGLSCAVVSEGESLWRKELSNPLLPGIDFFKGDKVTGGEFKDGRLVSVTTQMLEDDIKIVADYFLLCTGKFFSGGLVSDMDEIRESIFGADVTESAARENWSTEDFFAQQPFMSFGVKTSSEGKVLVNGGVIENLYAAGEVLEGIDPCADNSKDLIIDSAQSVVKQILKDAGIDNQQQQF